MDIDDLIEFENESTRLDFKAIQYRKENFYELLKDVIGMANAPIDGDKLIIVGVKKSSDGSFAIHPIEEQFFDSAIYQKLILDNIEPDLRIDYYAHKYKGNQLVGVLKIPASPDKPYMMKKQFGTDKQLRRPGESFIRKGTATFPLMRKDIDKMFEQRKQQDAFNHTITCYFSGTDLNKELCLKPNVPQKLTSQRKADEIQAILARREKEEKERTDRAIQKMLFPGIEALREPYLDFADPFGQPSPYEKRSTQTLLENLKNINKTYKDDDCYELFEKHSAKINITLLNEGTVYLEDATVEIRTPKKEGFYIADKIYRKPVYRSIAETLSHGIRPASHDELNYPKYEEQNGDYVFRQHIGDLRHLQPTDIFDVPLRLVIGPKLIGAEIEVRVIIFGRNLPIPIKDTLVIKVTEKSE
ncbi:AlbA family DNA-binding domain-containing protein [Spirosoma aerolatum]|uniref:AlbA family DNA-binding domain-containing protein n=1 Tax=Spirosoma aerolatum TaxID=1211326 RepID=UPI0009ACDD4D|nr:ATP-binding protein [Spirosoma aerolatum]